MRKADNYNNFKYSTSWVFQREVCVKWKGIGFLTTNLFVGYTTELKRTACPTFGIDMKPRVWAAILIGGVLSVRQELDVTYAPTGHAVQMHQRTKGEYVASLPMAWPCA